MEKRDDVFLDPKAHQLHDVLTRRAPVSPTGLTKLSEQIDKTLTQVNVPSAENLAFGLLKVPSTEPPSPSTPSTSALMDKLHEAPDQAGRPGWKADKVGNEPPISRESEEAQGEP